jgi:hypothetical protein
MAAQVTTQNFDAEVLGQASRCWSTSGPMVPALQGDGPDPRRPLQELAGKVKIVKLDVDDQSLDRGALQRARHAHDDRVQGRRAGRHEGRRRPVARAAGQVAGACLRVERDDPLSPAGCRSDAARGRRDRASRRRRRGRPGRRRRLRALRTEPPRLARSRGACAPAAMAAAGWAFGSPGMVRPQTCSAMPAKGRGSRRACGCSSGP